MILEDAAQQHKEKKIFAFFFFFWDKQRVGFCLFNLKKKPTKIDPNGIFIF